MEEEDKPDTYEQLLSRYGNSSASQHRHLIAAAAAVRSLLLSDHLTLTPLHYFAAALQTLSESSHDPDSFAALATVLSVALPRVKAIAPRKAAEAVGVLAGVVDREGEAVSTSSVRAVVKCFGVLLGFCDLENWDEVRFGFGKLLEFSIDRRPKVRKCAQDGAVSVFKSLKSSTLIKKAGQLVLSMLEEYMPLALEISDFKAMDGFKDEKPSKPEHQDIIHMLTLLKHVAPYLTVEVNLKVLQLMHKLMTSHVSPLARHIFYVTEAIIKTSPDESKRITHLPLVVGSIVNLLKNKDDTSSRASELLKKLISCLINNDLLAIVGESIEDEDKSSMESVALRSTCAYFENMLNSCVETPYEHSLSVISILFRELGELAYLYMKGIILQLADMINLACENKANTDHLQECIGSAVYAIGVEKILGLIPIKLDIEELTCSNAWLIPILRKYVARSSLGFFMEHFVPLAESFQKVSIKALKSGIQTDLLSYAHGIWGLLPAFCRYPNDTYQNFSSLAELLITFLQKDTLMLENTAIALQHLVYENKSALSSKEGACEVNDCSVEVKCKSSYTKKIARKNIKALESCSRKLLLAMMDAFFGSSPKERAYLKDAIRSLAFIADSSVTKTIFVSSLELLGLINEEQDNFTSGEKGEKICMALELASALFEGITEDLFALIFKLIKETLQGDKIIQSEAYHTLAKILEVQPMFCSSLVNELADLLLGLKPPVDIVAHRARLGCFQNLLFHSISTSEEENPKAFLVLNEIILTIKVSSEEGRKAAYDMLIGLSSNLQRSSSNLTPDAPFNKLISMIIGYLSAPSPQIKSGAISALSIMVYNNAEICVLIPDLVPSVLALLKNKALEVVKAVLGFVKVLVSCLQAMDLENLLPDILSAVLPWSPVSRNHFREKVTVIFEIMIRKCGSAKVESLVPDKYRSFLKSVQENRHGKQRSKETSATDLESEVSESSPRGNQHKRKHEESKFLRQKDNTMKKPRLKNWDRKSKGIIPSENEMHGNGARHVKSDGDSNNDRKFEGQLLGSTRNQGKHFKERVKTEKTMQKIGRGRWS